MGANVDPAAVRSKHVIGVLDIGTSKVCCLIAALGWETREPSTAGLRIIGIGHQRSRGVKAGIITDLVEAEEAVRTTIAKAERMAGVTLSQVLVSVSCGRLRSQVFTARTNAERSIVTQADIDRVTVAARAYAERDGRALLHMNRIGLALDGLPGVRHPEGMLARELSVEMHAVTADESPLRNLLQVVERCYVSTGGLVAAPYASALAVTSAEERHLGVTLIDLGGGTTTLAGFADGQLVYVDALPVGGEHITFDIARALHTPLEGAERIKTLYGTLVSAQSDEHEVFSFPLTGEEEGAAHHTTKAHLAALMRARVELLLGQVGQRLEKTGVSATAGRRVVLTGGSSQIAGMADFTARVLSCPVRVGRPQAVSGLPQVATSPQFSVAVGLLSATVSADVSMVTYGVSQASGEGYLERVGRWLREGL
jgi:cell division protein FtsA